MLRISVFVNSHPLVVHSLLGLCSLDTASQSIRWLTEANEALLSVFILCKLDRLNSSESLECFNQIVFRPCKRDVSDEQIISILIQNFGLLRTY